MKKPGLVIAVFSIALLLAACAPEVGSEEWCEMMEKKDKGDWSANEAKDYAKNCVFRKRDDD
jgi:protein involved in sex pheromone biosynthesis